MVARLPDRLSFRQAKVAVLVALLFGLIVLAFEFYADLRREQARIVETVQQVVRIVQEPAAKASYDVDPGLSAKVLEGLFSYAPIYKASIHTEFGMMAEESRPRSPDDKVSLLAEFLFGRDLDVVVPLVFSPPGRAPMPVGEIRATVDMRLAAAGFFERAGFTILGGMVRNLLTGLVLTAFFHFMITKPILQVSRDMLKVSPADPSSILVKCPEAHRSDEIGLLVARINEVLLAFDTAIMQRDDYAVALEDARSRAEEAGLAKSQFLATISHELRTPLNAIIGFSELMASPDMPASVRGNYSAEILASGNHLLSLINDILELAEIDRGSHRVALEPLNVERLVQSCSRIVAPLARSRNIRFEVRVPPRCPPVLADGRAIRQVLVHLLSNAVKFGTDGGRIQLTGEMDGARVVLEVKDDGTGIPPERLSRIYEPFWQDEPFLSRRSEGAGIGLPLAKALTEMQGGSLVIESEVGLGTTARVILPAADGPEGRPGAPGADAPGSVVSLGAT